MGVIAAAIIGMALLIMNWQPGSRVVLLPDANGKVGAVMVTTDSRQQLLAIAYGSASTNAKGAITLQSEDAAQVRQRYAATLDARPQPPVSFILYFEFGSAVDISPAFKPVLAQLLAALPSYPAPEITVIGHTDRVGSLESNDLLSLQRAQTVRDLIVKAGIQPDMIGVSGRGEREPLVATDDEVPEEKNRRVEINLR
jgi:outer membrane protein OmpA-like peptidoglycan-associated protein